MLTDVMVLLMVAIAAEGGEGLTIASFESEEEIGRIELSHASAQLSREHVANGSHSLKVHFEKATWPGIGFSMGKAYAAQDWTKYGCLLFDVFNPEENPVAVSIRVDDHKSAGSRGNWLQGRTEVPPRRLATVVFPLRYNEFGMRGLPVTVEGHIFAGRGPTEIDLSQVTQLLIFLPRPEKPHTLFIDNVRLSPMPRLEGIVDRFGQYSFGEWPGKLKDESELTKRREDEAEYLKTAPAPVDRDEFGGWASGPKVTATGFFRTEKVGGKWWLVTPTGHLFWSVGIDAVRPQSIPTPVEGREYMFTWLPSKDHPAYQSIQRKRSFSFYMANIMRKYGKDYETRWLDVTFRRLWTWGFNTIGNWSSDIVFRARRMPYTVAIHYGWRVRRFETFPVGLRKQMPDVFDENFGKAVEDTIEEGTSEWREDPWCLGYFVDNELPWGHSGQQLPREMLLSEKPLTAKKVFAEQLRKKYGDIGELNHAWRTGIESWEHIQSEAVRLPEEATAAMHEDMSEFLTVFARRYFSIVRDTMKQHAPKQLYLGARFAGRPPQEVVSVADKFCDVVSFNCYCAADKFVERLAQAAALTKPVIIGEFHFGALDRGMFHTGLGPVANQEERGEAYAAYVREALAQPWCVGVHWFTYIDQPLTGRFDGENYNIGFVDCTDTPYPELTSAARDINFQIYQLRGVN